MKNILFQVFNKKILEYSRSSFRTGFYIPELKIGIEFDGSYWHKSKEKKDIKKNQFLKEKNIYLIRVREFPLKKIEKNDVCVAQDKIIKEDIDRVKNRIISIEKKDGKFKFR